MKFEDATKKALAGAARLIRIVPVGIAIVAPPPIARLIEKYAPVPGDVGNASVVV